MARRDKAVGHAKPDSPGTAWLAAVGIWCGAALLLLRVSAGLVGDTPGEQASSAGPGAEPPTIRLSEVLAFNRTLVNPNGTTADWVEVENYGITTVDLSGLGLSDKPAAPPRWVFPAGTTLRAGGYLVVLCDGDASSDAQNTGFGLNGEGDGLYLFAGPAEGSRLVDGVSFGLQVADWSLGRVGPNAGWRLSRPTPGAANFEATLGDPTVLRLNEWMASPLAGADWFELYNPGPNPVALGGLAFTDNLQRPGMSPIPPLSFLGGGAQGFQVFWADGQTNLGARHVAFRLAREGEAIGLFTAQGAPIDTVQYGPQRPGVSEGRFPDGSTNLIQFEALSTPGAANAQPVVEVVINEVLSHTDPPLEDAIELHNPTAQAVDIGGWYLSDSAADLRKYRLPFGTVIEPGGFWVFYEYQFNPLPGIPPSFELNALNGGTVYLSRADPLGQLTGETTLAHFGTSENGMSQGRHETSVGVDFVPLGRRSFGVDTPRTVREFRQGHGLANAYPRLGPVVISEVMYHPVTWDGANLSERAEEEYVELRNVMDAPVALAVDAANTWCLRGAIEYAFPTNAVLAAQDCALVVSFDPTTNRAALTAFQARYRLPAGVKLFGPYRGRLANEGETLELFRSFRPGWPRILVEFLGYSNQPPWPVAADGRGWSLQRSSGFEYGNEPLNWTASLPSPGQPNELSAAPLDTDRDGMPDVWEIAFGLNPDDPADPAQDADGDGLPNAREYLAHTDPRDSQSGLRLSLLPFGNQLLLRFQAEPGTPYALQYREALTQGPWLNFTNVSPGAYRRLMDVRAAGGAEGARFYRLAVLPP